MNDAIDIGRVEFNGIQYGLLLVVQLQFGWSSDRAIRRDLRILDHRAQALDDIVGILGKYCAIANQLMAALRYSRLNWAWQSEDIASLFGSVSSGDQGARSPSGFDH